MQGSGADIIKLAMLRVDELIARRGLPAALLLTVHDELVLEAPADEAEIVATMVRQEMAGVAELAVPLVVDSGVGPTWFDAKG